MKHRIHVKRRNKVSVIGAGLVGSTYAYTLMMSGTASEIVLLDARTSRAFRTCIRRRSRREAAS
jgi:3-hydroxyacyl-CoA dehydrogenase